MSPLRSWLPIAGLVALSACGAPAPTAEIPAPAATPTAVSPTAAPTATSTPAPTLTSTPSATPVPEPFRVVGYVTAATVLGTVRYDQLTHINYAFLVPNADGTFAPLPNRWKLDELAAAAHAHDVRVLISVGGWGWDAEFEALAADPPSRARFVQGVAALVAAHHLDGADIDWEYPDAGPSSANFLALLQELRAALPPGKLLTAAVVALGDHGAGVPAEAFALLDFVNLMAYDGAGPQHASYAYAEASLDYWLGRGLPAAQTVLGVPFYARPDGVAYRVLVEANPAAAQADEIEHFGRLLNYNGLDTMRRKTQLALARAGGLMIWALEHDTRDGTSLLSAIHATVRGAD